MKYPVNVAVVQQPPVFMNLSESTELAVRYVQECSGQGNEIIVFPETWLPGYPVWLDYAPNAGIWDHPPAKALYRILSDNSIQINDPYFNRLSEAAVESSSLIIMGAHEKAGRTLYNTLFYFKPDGSFDLHRKLMPTYTERLIWGMGDGSTLPVIEHNKSRIGGLICWEHWMPLARAAMYEKGEHIHIAQWPMVKELHQIASRNYAFESQSFVIAAGATLSKTQAIEGIESVLQKKEDRAALELIEDINIGDDELLLRGGSCIISPGTEFITDPLFDESAIISAELDPDKLSEGNLFIDTNGHYSRPDVFQLKVDTKPKSNVLFEDE